jgi:hypothetical protein
MRHFFILGNAHSGTSLLRGLLNAHSKLYVDFEYFENKKFNEQFAIWFEKQIEIDRMNKIYGNKIPIEQFRTALWTDEQILQIGRKGFKIIWIQRRFSGYNEGYNTETEKLYWNNWVWGRTLYWMFKEQHPTRILQVSFEDLLLQTEIELKRLCYFLGIEYEDNMLIEGPRNTGYPRYDQSTINQSRI